jgi:hypothetical protein
MHLICAEFVHRLSLNPWPLPVPRDVDGKAGVTTPRKSNPKQQNVGLASTKTMKQDDAR